MTSIGEKFGELEDILQRIAADLREVDPANLDEESKQYLHEASVLAEWYGDALAGTESWKDAHAAMVKLIYED